MRGSTFDRGQDGQRTLSGGWDDLAHLAEVVDALRRSSGIAGHGTRQAMGPTFAGYHNLNCHGIHGVLAEGFCEGTVEIEVAERLGPTPDDRALP
jgi:hypothetical protein